MDVFCQELSYFNNFFMTNFNTTIHLQRKSCIATNMQAIKKESKKDNVSMRVKVVINVVKNGCMNSVYNSEMG